MAESSARDPGVGQTFGPFELAPGRDRLCFNGVALPLHGDAFAVLAVLVECQGGPLGRTELLARIAPSGHIGSKELWDRVVEVNVVLRENAASAGHVEYHPSQGFGFIVAGTPISNVASDLGQRRFPSRLAPVFGRDEAIASIAAQLPLGRFITIVGPGGMGKTTLALALVDQLRDAYAEGIFFVDLAPLADARLIVHAVASALGASPDFELSHLTAYLGRRQMLIVLDNCEHVVEAAAELVEALLSASPCLHVLATSREPLRASGEWLHRLAPMQLPPKGTELTAQEAIAWPGVQLFVERMRAAGASQPFDDTVAGDIVALCRHVDGIALAIELAAARVALLSVRGVIGQIEKRLMSLGGGRRGAPARHRTLMAMIDWSYDLLAPLEQRVLRRLSVFSGVFTLEAAEAIAGCDTPGQVRGAVLDLAAKSLVAMVPQATSPGLRLLDTTRAYASAKLGNNEEFNATRLRHALYLREMLQRAEREWEAMTRTAWRETYSPWIADVRAALAWAFSPAGDPELAVALTCEAFALSDQTKMMSDYGEWVARALEAVAALVPPRPLLEMRLRMFPALLHQRLQTDQPASLPWLSRALEVAHETGIARYQTGPILALWAEAFQSGDYPAASTWAERLARVAHDAADETSSLIARRMLAQSLHFGGEHARSRALLHDVLENAGRKTPLAYVPSPVDVRVSMRIVLARILWLKGFAEQAAAVAQEGVEHALADTPLSACQVLALATIPIALWSGGHDECRRRVEQLREQTLTHSFDYWQPWWRLYEGLLARHGGSADVSAEALTGEQPLRRKLLDHLATFDVRLLSAATIRRVEAGTVGWCAPEVLRAHGESLLGRDGRDSEAAAEALFLRALELARTQGALAWELRAATSLARLLVLQERRERARATLEPVYVRFTEGLATADLRAASGLLAELGVDPRPGITQCGALS